MEEQFKEMITHKDYTKPYWITLNDDDSVYHYGKIHQGQQLSTANTFECYPTFVEWLNRLVELTVYPTEDELKGLEDDEIENV